MKKVLFLFLFLFLLLSREASAALSLDGSNTTGAAATVLTTSLSNDIIIVFGACISTATATGVSDTAGLTWVKRQAIEYNAGAAALDEWYAISPGALTSDTITMTWASCSSSTRVYAFGINGANLTTPFDPNVSLPAQTSGILASSTSVTVSTSNANDMLITGYRASLNGFATRPTGFTVIQSPNNAGDTSYEIVSSTQSSQTFTYTNAASTTNAWLFDAIQQAGSSPPASNLLLGNGF